MIKNLNEKALRETKAGVKEQIASFNGNLEQKQEIHPIIDGFMTKNVLKDDEAIEKKMKLLNAKVFGLFSPVHYSLISKRKVFIPFEMLVFSYRIEKGKNLQVSSLRSREGEIGVIYDLNEEHAFHYDLYDNLNLIQTSFDGLNEVVLPEKCTEEEVVSRCKDIVRWKMLSRVFKGIGTLTLVKRKKFYREAWELTTMCRGREYIRYAFKDNYSSQNEHVSGLKIRLDV